jgi:hypothetical protein
LVPKSHVPVLYVRNPPVTESDVSDILVDTTPERVLKLPESEFNPQESAKI